MIDYYEILKVSPNVNEAGLKKAYEGMIEQHDPGKFHSKYKHQAAEQIRLFNEAYRILSDPRERRQYDTRLARQTRIPSFTPHSLMKPILQIIGVALFVFVCLQLVVVLAKSAFSSMALMFIIPLFLIILFSWVLKNQKKKLRSYGKRFRAR